MVKYKNGDCFVKIYGDGTKIRKYDGEPSPIFPESIDIKITDYCDMGCAYCHESSTTKGKHGDMQVLLEKLDGFPAGIELAIGGGNPMSHPDLFFFLSEAKPRGFICNLTVNQGHLKKSLDTLSFFIENDLIKGLGVSLTNNNLKYVKMLNDKTQNLVFHVIAGVNEVEEVDRLIKEMDAPKILVLGYKDYGFGVAYRRPEVDEGIERWKNNIKRFIGKCGLSFDNLAIEQLDIRRFFTDRAWDVFYMGDDFSFTMYIDAVKQEYGRTSRDGERMPFSNLSIQDYFQYNYMKPSRAEQTIEKLFKFSPTNVQ
jgi:MoaA/NifB/PqqE/SkfB family radical SAM enzyme